MTPAIAGRGIVAASAIAACSFLLAWCAVPSTSAASFATGLSDFQPFDEDNGTLSGAADSRASVVRINVFWRAITTTRPTSEANPADPGYDFASLDAEVRAAASRGFRIVFMVVGAPDWAEGANQPNDAPEGTWKPDPGAFGRFATALATRYSGDFDGLPRVRYYEAWNEPNLTDFLSPTWVGNSPYAAEHYRKLLNAFYDGVKKVDRSNLVIAGATAPYGDPPGGRRMRPLRFWREVLCLKEKGNKLRRKNCPERPSFDIASDHPINLSGGPRRSAIHPDDVSTPDLKNLGATIRAAERLGTIAGGRKRHPLWVTEIWWESNPPDLKYGLPLDIQAHYIEEALYVLWKQGAKVAIYLSVIDEPYDPDRPAVGLHAGLYFRDGSPKPAATAFRFPFVTERKGKRKVLAWGKAPAAGKLTIEQKTKKGWRSVGGERVRVGEVFTDNLNFRGNAKLRASVGGEQSLVWSQR